MVVPSSFDNEQQLRDCLAQLYPKVLLSGTELKSLLVSVLAIEDESLQETLFSFANDICQSVYGKGILLRGLIEFTNRCRNTCSYCGLNRFNNEIDRYHLSDDEILHAVGLIHHFNIKTIVLQSGEVEHPSPEWLANLVRTIKTQYPEVAVTLSVGEHPEGYYQTWREAGADRYLLKLETTTPELYEQLHPGMSMDQRKHCSATLRKLGYQTGSGNIVGLPGQTFEHLAEDILYFWQNQFEMTSISPLIPHPKTPLADAPTADPNLVCRVIALTRILCPRSLMPATTAMGSLNGQDYRPHALKAGCNVVMLNYTPITVKKQYEIYPGKRCLNESYCTVSCLGMMAKSIGRELSFEIGHVAGMC